MLVRWEKGRPRRQSPPEGQRSVFLGWERGDVLLHGAHVVSSSVVHEGGCTAAVEEVDAHTGAVSCVGGCQTAIEVRGEVHGGAVVFAWGEDSRDQNALVEFRGVVADDGGVDDEGEDGELVLGGVVCEEAGGVVVADGHVGGALGGDGAERRCHGEGFEEHGGRVGEVERGEEVRSVLKK
jgi:hypothetical protein